MNLGVHVPGFSSKVSTSGLRVWSRVGGGGVGRFWDSIQDCGTPNPKQTLNPKLRGFGSLSPAFNHPCFRRAESWDPCFVQRFRL